LPTHLACASVTRGRVLETHEASLHAVAAKLYFISMGHGLWIAMGHVSALEPTSKAGTVLSRRTRVSVGSLLNGEVGSNAEGRVSAPDPSWMAGGIRSLRQMAAPEPSLSREVGFSTAVARGNVWMHTLPFVLA
jgi:hypothetical protein